ncbi:hypothetical protein [Pedobacter sp.]|uniref:hypothetical protein n=1 Tax=Pedobacter sp. TaxID=1411316 RepID=UPI00396C9959
MKKLLLLLILAFCTSVVDAQLTYKNIIIGTNTSANGRAPQTSHRNTKCVYYIPASEMSDGGVGAGTQLKGIGFSYKDATAAMTATGSLKIYLQNTTDADYQKGTSFSAAIATMTKVSDGTVTLTSTAATDFEFQNGDAFTYAGGGLYVAFEWSNAGTLGTANTAFCNNSQINGKDGLFSSSSTSSATGASNTIATSPFRPYTRFAYQLPANDAGVSSVYAMSTAPVNEGLQKIAARITNNGLAIQNNIDVTLTITGANTFTSTKNIATLASEASTVVTF